MIADQGLGTSPTTSFFARSRNGMTDDHDLYPSASSDEATQHLVTPQDQQATFGHGLSSSTDRQFPFRELSTSSFFSLSQAQSKVAAQQSKMSPCSCSNRLLALCSLPDPAMGPPDAMGTREAMDANGPIIALLHSVLICDHAESIDSLLLVAILTSRLISSYSIASRSSISLFIGPTTDASRDDVRRVLTADGLRDAARSLLGEVHKVRTIIKSLTTRFNSYLQQSRDTSSVPVSNTIAPPQVVALQYTSPWTLQDIEDKLKTEVAELSRGLVTMLQQL